MNDLHDFLEPVNTAEINEDKDFNDSQMGNVLKINEGSMPDLKGIDIVLVGVNEYRGEAYLPDDHSADEIRKQFYRLHYWHHNVQIADIGNIKAGATLKDTYHALKIVLKELLKLKKTVVIIGGSHDNTLAQYYAYKEMNQLIEATVVDSVIDLKSESPLPNENFLMEMLTSEPNLVRHYNHIGFQSYFVHPHMLETIDKLRFDCFRVGYAREKPDEMEPVLRTSDMMSFDISAIKYSDSPASSHSPNGFTGEDACNLMRFAGMSPQISTVGVYGYKAEQDVKNLSAMQISQMLWYFVDGKSKSKYEAPLDEKQHFNEFHTAFAEVDTVFLQSKKTGRWWMQLPNKKMIACSYKDYLLASNDEIPERWFRAQEREG